MVNSVVTTNNYRDDLAYKRDNLVDSIVTTNPGTEKVGSYAYGFDANKNKTSETISGGGVSNSFGFSTGTTGYDGDNRLVNWNRTDGNLDQAWSLSLVGDWNTSTKNGTTVNRTHNALHEVATVGGATLTHDARGNLTVDSNGQVFTFDFDNRMSSADTNGGGAEIVYEYDALGRRVKADNTVFAFAGKQVVAEYSVGASSALPVEKYVYGSFVDEPILKDGTGGILYYSRNQQYSITALTDSAGQVVERYAYDAYGELSIFSGSGTALALSAFNNRYTFTGRRHDPETGLYYFRARYFSPSLGRFISRDPLGFIDGLSLYNGYFVPNSVDPSGKHHVRPTVRPRPPVRRPGAPRTPGFAGCNFGRDLPMEGVERYRRRKNKKATMKDLCEQCERWRKLNPSRPKYPGGGRPEPHFCGPRAPNPCQKRWGYERCPVPATFPSTIARQFLEAQGVDLSAFEQRVPRRFVISRCYPANKKQWENEPNICPSGGQQYHCRVMMMDHYKGLANFDPIIEVSVTVCNCCHETRRGKYAKPLSTKGGDGEAHWAYDTKTGRGGLDSNGNPVRLFDFPSNHN